MVLFALQTISTVFDFLELVFFFFKLLKSARIQSWNLNILTNHVEKERKIQIASRREKVWSLSNSPDLRLACTLWWTHLRSGCRHLGWSPTQLVCISFSFCWHSKKKDRAVAGNKISRFIGFSTLGIQIQLSYPTKSGTDNRWELPNHQSQECWRWKELDLLLIPDEKRFSW